jgi:hypothetical protein
VSKGHGRIMLEVLSRIGPDWIEVIDLAGEIEGAPEISRAAIETTRRAVKRLEREGRIEVAYRCMRSGYILREHGWGYVRAALVVRQKADKC